MLETINSPASSEEDLYHEIAPTTLRASPNKLGAKALNIPFGIEHLEDFPVSPSGEHKNSFTGTLKDDNKTDSVMDD